MADIPELNPADLLGKCCNVLKNNTEEYNKHTKEHNEKTEKLISAINDLEKGFKEGIDELKKLFDSMRDQITKSTKATKDLVKETKASTAGGSGSTAGGGSGGGGKNKGSARPSGGGGWKKQGESIGQDLFNGLSSRFNSGSMASAIFVAFTKGMQPINMAFNGLLSDEKEFMIRMREIGYVTQGITGDFLDAQEAFQKLNKTVGITGVNLTVFQKEYVKNLQRGVKTQKDMVSVTKTGLHVSTMVGDTSNAIADTLARWHMTMGLTTGQTAQLGRGIIGVARETGLMGENLKNVVATSEHLVETMRNVGTLTAESASSIIRLLASAEKIGVGKQMGEMAEGMASLHNVLNSTNPQMQNLMFMIANGAGKMKELKEGTLMVGREGQRSVAEGIKNTLAKLGADVSLDPSKISKEVHFVVQNITGKTFGELKRMHDAALESSKPFADKVSEITKKINDQNTTEKQRLLLEKQLLDLQLSRGFEFVSKFQEAADSSTSMNDAMAKYSAAMAKDKDMMDDLAKAGVNTANSMEMAKGAMVYGAEKLKKAGGKDFTADIAKAIGSGDLKGIKTVMEQMSEEQQKLGMSEKKKADPFSEVNQHLMEINETVRDFFGGTLRRWSGFMVKLVVLSSLVAQLVGLMGGMKTLWDGAKGYFKLGRAYFGGQGPGIKKQAIEDAKANIKTILSRCKDTAKCEAVAEKAGGAAKQKMFDFAESKKGMPKAPPTAAGGGPAESVPFNMPEFKFSNMKKIAGTLLKGAAALVALGAALLVLGGVMVTLGRIVLGTFGLDQKKIEEIVGGMMSLIWGLAKISGAIILATIPIALIGAAVDSGILEALTPLLLSGAVALLVLTPAMMALSLAIIGMGAILNYFVDPNKAAEIADGVASILWSAAKISGAILLSSAALSVLGALALGTGWVGVAAAAVLMTLGSGALLALSVPVMGLASAIIGMGALMSKVIDPKRAAEVADAVASIIWSAAKISGSILLASTALTVLGAFALGTGWIGIALAASMMTVGAAALAVLAVPVTALAAAIIGMGALISKIIDPKWAAEVADSVASIIWSASKISGYIIAASASLSVIGALAIGTGWIGVAVAVGLMTAGAAALTTLAVPVMGLAAAIIGMGAIFTKTVNPKKAVEIADGVASILESSAKISDSVIKQSDLIKSQAGGILSGIMSWFVPTLQDGADAFMSLAKPTMKITRAILYLAAAFVDTVNPEVAKEVANDMADIMEASTRIMKSINTQAGLIKAQYKGGLFSWVKSWFAPTLEDGAKAFMELAEPVTDITRSILYMSAAFVDTVDPSVAKEVASDMANIMESSARIMAAIDAQAKVLKAQDTGGLFSWVKSWFAPTLEDGAKAFMELAEPVNNITRSILYMSAAFVDTINPEESVKVAKHMADVMESSTKIMSAIQSQADMLKAQSKGGGLFSWVKSWFAPTLEDGAKAFEELMPPVTHMAESILRMADQFTGKISIDGAKQVADELVALMDASKLIGDTITMFSDTVAPMTTKDWFGFGSSPLEKFLTGMGDFATQLISHIETAFPEAGKLQSAVEKLKMTAEIMEKVGTIKIPASLDAGTIPTLGNAANTVANNIDVSTDKAAAKAAVGDGGQAKAAAKAAIGGVTATKTGGFWASIMSGIKSLFFSDTNAAQKSVEVVQKETETGNKEITSRIYKKGVNKFTEDTNKTAKLSQKTVAANMASVKESTDSMVSTMYGTMTKQSGNMAQEANDILKGQIKVQEAKQEASLRKLQEKIDAADKAKAAGGGPAEIKAAIDSVDKPATAAGAAGAAASTDKPTVRPGTVNRKPQPLPEAALPTSGIEKIVAENETPEDQLRVYGQKLKKRMVGGRTYATAGARAMAASRAAMRGRDLSSIPEVSTDTEAGGSHLDRISKPGNHLDRISASGDHLKRMTEGGNHLDRMTEGGTNLSRMSAADKYYPTRDLKSGYATGGSFIVGEMGPEKVTINPIGKASAGSVNDVYDRMRQEQSVAQSAVGTSSQTGKLESLNEQQVNFLNEINSNIAILVSLMKPSDTQRAGSGGGKPMATQNTPARSTDYATWQFGTQMSGPGTQSVNAGIA